MLRLPTIASFALIGTALFLMVPAAPARAQTGPTPSGEESVVGRPDGVPPPAPAPVASTTERPRLRDLPLESRDPIDAAVQMAPGTLATPTGPRLRGGHPDNLGVVVDGFRVYHLRPPLAFVDRADVVAAGYGAAFDDVPEGAVVLDAGPPPGALSATAELYQESQEYRLFGTDEQSSFDSPLSATDRVVSLGLGGRLLHDRLSIKSTLNHESASLTTWRDPEGVLAAPPAPTGGLWNGALAAGFRPTPRNQVDALALWQKSRLENGSGLGVFPEAQPLQDRQAFMFGLGWTTAFSQRVSGRLDASFERAKVLVRSMLCVTNPDCENVPTFVNKFPRRLQTGNRTDFIDHVESRQHLGASLTASFGDPARAFHTLTAWSRADRGRHEESWRTPGDMLTEYNGGVPEARTTAFANDPRVEPGVQGWVAATATSWRFHQAIEDDLRLFRRLNVRAGIGWLASHVSDDQGDGVILGGSGLTAHLRADWDVRGDDRSVLSFSTSRRLDAMADARVPRLRDRRISQRCIWDAALQSYSTTVCTVTSRSPETVGHPCSPDGIGDDGQPCIRTPGMPQIWEHTLGARQRLTARSWLSLDVVYRKTSGLPVTTETNRIWNASGTVTSGYRNGHPETVIDFSTSPDTWRRYMGGTVALQGNLGDFFGAAAYTYSRLEVAEQGVPLVGGGGPGIYTSLDVDDRPHSARVVARYRVERLISAAVTYAYDSGRPLALIRSGATLNPFDARGTRGTNPGTDINDPGVPTQARLDSIDRLNLQLRVELGRFIPVGLDVYADVLNLLDKPFFGAGDSPGRWTRIGIEGRY